MPDDINGNHSLPAGYEAKTGQKVLASQHNPPLEDLSQSMTNRLSRSGLAPMLANLPMGDRKIVDLAPATEPSDAVTLAQITGIVPIGVVLDYFGTTSPTGWMFCAGQELSRTTYAALFAVIGTNGGAGNGTTTFNLPDLRGYVTAGRDNMGGTAANRLTTEGGGVNGGSLGAKGGSQAHTLTSAQMPEHLHGVGTLATASAGAHTHTFPLGIDNVGAASTLLQRTAGAGQESSSAGSHTHTITGSTGSAGAGNAHPNVQPTFVMNKIIKVSN